MTNPNNPDVSTPIRLPKQAAVPTPQEIVDTAHESKRSKKRVELPWQPAGRAEPVVLAVMHDVSCSKPHWTIYNGQKAEALSVWDSLDPGSHDVIMALHDWYMEAGDTEGWKRGSTDDPFLEVLEAIFAAAKPAHKLEPFAASTEQGGVAGAPGQQALPGQADNIPPAPTGNPNMEPARYGYPAPPDGSQGYPPGYGIPPGAYHQPGWASGYQVPYGYQYPYPVPVNPPPHWAHSYPQQAQPAPPNQMPMAPEMWSLQNTAPAPIPASSTVPPLGDLLVAANLIQTPALHAALSLQNASPVGHTRLGEILVNSGALPRHLLRSALSLQDLARKGIINSSRITEHLKQVQVTGATVEQLLGFAPGTAIALATNQSKQNPASAAQTSLPASSSAQSELRTAAVPSPEGLAPTPQEQERARQVKEVLKQFADKDSDKKAGIILNLFSQAGVLNAGSLEKASQDSKTKAETVKALLADEALDPSLLQAGIDCLKLLGSNRFKPEQAIIALGYCHRGRVQLKDAIGDLDWPVAIDDL